MKMNLIKISIIKIEFKEFVEVKQYMKKPASKVTSRKYDFMRHMAFPREERKYE